MEGVASYSFMFSDGERNFSSKFILESCIGQSLRLAGLSIRVRVISTRVVYETIKIEKVYY